MGVSIPVPPALALTVGEAGRRVSLELGQPLFATPWASLEALDMDVGGGAFRPTNGHPAAAEPVERLKTRRLALRAATLVTDVTRLQAALGRLVPASSGFTDLRLGARAGGLWLGGRVTIGNRAAPFTLRVAAAPRVTGPRRLGLFLGDVRLYAPLPLAAPLVGTALARAIVAGAGGPSARLDARDGALELAPLELALVSALVARGWRLPDLSRATLRQLTGPDDGGALRLIFDDHGGDAAPREDGGAAAGGPGSWLEGERLPEALTAGEHALFAGELRAAEEAYRSHLAAHPGDRAAQARLVALAAPAAPASFQEQAQALIRAWPELIPGWLYAALASWQAGDRDTAAERFARAAELAEARGEAEDARLARAAAAEAGAAAAPANDLGDGAAAPGPVEPADPGSITGRTAAVYAGEPDAQARAGALGALLRDFDRLPPERRRAAYASFGRVAESSGDLERAEEAYRRGTDVEGQPDERAAFLIAHARLLLSRGNDRAAVADLDEALRLAPDAARAQAARAELAFRARDWDLARALYARLDRAADAAEVIPRETLVHRRALLARAAGDDAGAEACYRELAILDPRQVEARQALADLALGRGDRATAARRLEEVLRLLPLDALEATLEVRQRLADLYIGLGDWTAARDYLELILAQDGAQAAAVEKLADALEHLGQFEEAAAACERLARLDPEPARRASALNRQGEILLERLHDEPRAFDAFLKASDLSPGSGPTSMRLATGFWLRGRFDDLAEVADELARAGALADAPLPLRMRLAIGAAIAGRQPAVPLERGAGEARELALALAEAAQGLGPAAPARLELALKLVVAPGPDGRGALMALSNALAARLQEDPGAAWGGVALALGWLADRRGESSAARPLYALADFLSGAEGVRNRLAELGPAPPPTNDVMALAGGCDHPGVGGIAAPLRRALGALARGLAGLGPLGARPETAGEPRIAASRLDAWGALARTMDAPPLDLGVAGTAGTQTHVSALATRPGLVTIPAAMLGLPEDELTFWVARAIDRLRNGVALVEASTEGTAKEVEALLQGAAAALAGRPAPEAPLGAAAAAALASPERVAGLLGAAPRPRVAGDLLLAEEALAGWGGFLRAADWASDRFAALACRGPRAALGALYRQHPGDELSSEPARRAAFLRTPRLRELVAFMTSPAYADATRDDARA